MHYDSIALPRCFTENEDGTVRENSIGVQHLSNWEMFRGGAGGLGGCNVGVDTDHDLHHVFDIGGDVAPLLDDALAVVAAAVDPAPGL